MPLPYPFSFQGRARRGEWWLTNIGFGLLAAVLMAVANMLFSGDWRGWRPGEPAEPALMAIRVVYAVFLTWVQLAVSYRRAHDLGDSGLPLAVLMGVATAINLTVAITGADWIAAIRASGAGFFLAGVWIVGALISLYLFSRLAFFPSQPGANAYGAPT